MICLHVPKNKDRSTALTKKHQYIKRITITRNCWIGLKYILCAAYIVYLRLYVPFNNKQKNDKVKSLVWIQTYALCRPQSQLTIVHTLNNKRNNELDCSKYWLEAVVLSMVSLSERNNSVAVCTST